ncbi:unnamed protein product [Miscanthus lutarioriparius]|uniref:Ribosomal RNA-processing protein 42 n=1 Tax=Miscanthus lutarioriparius TaxID=422564 RepID=A0A811SC82_9POAL|nr:unnamed protein product [Miscanthus lutarioriparius]
MVGLSEGEKDFIRGGIAQDLRTDGRRRLQFRALSVQTGVIPQANGSARVRLGATEIIASVKAELGKPSILHPDKGKVSIFVDCSPTAEPMFEGRGSEELSSELSVSLQRCLLGGKSGAGAAIDLSSLIVVEGKVCWDLYIDGLVVSSDGNLLDALAAAIKVALSDTGIPKVNVSVNTASDEEPEVDVSDEEFLQFDTSSVPVIITLTKVGRHYIVDATSEEESQMSSAVSVSVNRHGQICGLTKRGGAGLDPSVIFDMISVAKHDHMNGSYTSSLSLHDVSVDDGQSALDNSSRASSPFDILTPQDVIPIETARSRFLDLVVDYFICEHVIEMVECSGSDCSQVDGKSNKRKQQEVRYEGDPRVALPLMYIANLYETLVSDVNVRLAALIGFHEKTIGLALEASGGLYRKLTQRFPKRGHCSFKRRELATSHATRTKFPELVVQEEKRVRFVVINRLAIIERPENMRMEDAEWFKRLTGRSEVAICSRDYKFYSPRHKIRRSPQAAFDIPDKSALAEDENSSLVCSSGFRSPNEFLLACSSCGIIK